MKQMKAIAGGVVGGLIGTAIWVAIGYGTHREIGWIAWGIGALVGLGVRVASQEWDGVHPGVIAVIIAITSVVAGKYIVVTLIARQFTNELTYRATDEDLIQNFANDIVQDRKTKGKKLAWPAGKSLENAEKSADYPKDVWQEATKKWTALPSAEQQSLRKKEEEQFANLKDAIQGFARNEGFKSSFGPFDLLWFGLAAFTAFRIGSGVSKSE